MAVLVGRKAPHFSETAVVNGKDIVDGFSLDQYLGNKYVILFFYPKDFTFVCPTEIHAFQEKLGEFEARNCAVVGVSTDTAETHQAYLRVAKDQGGIEGVTYPSSRTPTKPSPPTTTCWPGSTTTTKKAT